MRKMTWRSGSCLVQLPPSSSKCVVYQVKNTIIVSFKSHMGPNLFPHTDNCTLKVEDKRKTLLVSMVMSYSKCRHCCGVCVDLSWGNNSNVDYRIYKYKFRVLQSNLIILFASHTWSCYKSVFQSIQHRGGSVSILAFYMQFTVKWRKFVLHKCSVISYK